MQEAYLKWLAYYEQKAKNIRANQGESDFERSQRERRERMTQCRATNPVPKPGDACMR
jgi:hypothetical protein